MHRICYLPILSTREAMVAVQLGVEVKLRCSDIKNECTSMCLMPS